MDETKRIKVFRCLLVIALVVWTGFIFGNSLKDVAASSHQSYEVLIKVAPEVIEDPKTEVIAHNQLRKLAHFLEFFLLGALWFGVLIRKEKGLLPVGILSFLLTAGTACVDEGLQVFSDRDGSLEDVLTDCTGGLTAILILMGIWGILRFLRRNNR